MSAWTMYKQS
jgi:hypothetical protein